MDPHTWPGKSRTTSTNIDSATMWGYRILSRRHAWGDERLGKVAREGQGYPWYQHDMMMMMMIFSIRLLFSQFKRQTVLFDQKIRLYQVHMLLARVDSGVMVTKGSAHSPKHQHYSRFTIWLFCVIPQHLLYGRVLPLCRDSVGVFYSSSRLGILNQEERQNCWCSKVIQEKTQSSGMETFASIRKRYFQARTFQNTFKLKKKSSKIEDL